MIDGPQRVALWPAEGRARYVDRPTAYKLLDGKAGFVSRSLWWMLHKLGTLTPWIEKIETYTFEPARQEKLHNAMLRTANGSSLDLAYVYEKKAVFVIGSKDFAALTGSPEFRNTMMFRTGPFGIQDPYHGRQIFDIPIHVVPNMSGLALIPKVIIEEVK